MKVIFSTGIVRKILVCAAIVLTGGFVFAALPSIRRMLSLAPWWWLGSAVATLALANVAMALVFMALVQRASPKLGAGRGLVGSFLVSQVAKYIPGRVWGVAMQAAMLGKPGATGGILSANLELALVNMVMVTGAGIAFLAWQRTGLLPAVAILFVAWGLGAWMLRLDATRWLAHIALRLLPRRSHRLFAGLARDGTGKPEGARLPMYGGLLLFLVMYCLGWWLLVTGLTSLDGRASMGVVAALSLSYIVGVASMLPAGIGAREGALVMLAPVLGVPHVDMAALAVTSRAAMVLMDALAGGVGILLLRQRAAKGGQDV